MFAASGGVGNELTLKELRLSESVEGERGEEEDVELSDGVACRRVFRIRPGKRCGNGALFRFPGSSLLLRGIERGTSVTGSEVGLGLWKAFEQETGAQTGRRS